jgi:hypothetical protein
VERNCTYRRIVFSPPPHYQWKETVPISGIVFLHHHPKAGKKLY